MLFEVEIVLDAAKLRDIIIRTTRPMWSLGIMGHSRKGSFRRRDGVYHLRYFFEKCTCDLAYSINFQSFIQQHCMCFNFLSLWANIYI